MAIDGKSVRGSTSDTEGAPDLPAAIDHHAAVQLGQVDVASKTNEIPMFEQLCDCPDDLTNAVMTVDALHAQKTHADYLVLGRAAHYLIDEHRHGQSAYPGQEFRPRRPPTVALTGGSRRAS